MPKTARKHYIPIVKTFITKVVGSRGIVVHEFDSEELKINNLNYLFCMMIIHFNHLIKYYEIENLLSTV